MAHNPCSQQAAAVPAEKAVYRSPANARNRPSAIWLRAELCVQRKRTRRFSTLCLLMLTTLSAAGSSRVAEAMRVSYRAETPAPVQPAHWQA